MVHLTRPTRVRSADAVRPAPAGARPGMPTRRASAKWPLWGAAAGVLGASAHLIVNPQVRMAEDQRVLGAAVIRDLDRAGYHVAAVTGFLAVACLLVTAAAWRRWAEHRVPDSVAARLVPAALAASAGAMVVGYGLMGSLAVYLPGGAHEGVFEVEGLYAVYVLLDLAPFVAWQGVSVAAAGVSWLAFAERLVPRWVGVVCGAGAAVPLAFLVATGLPALAGWTGPLALAAGFTGMALSRTRPIEAI